MVKEKPKFSFKYCLVCDDLRKEANNKLFFIGVYTDRILISEFPALLSLVFWIDLDVKGTGNLPLKFRAFLTPKRKQIFEADGIIDVLEGSKQISISLRGKPITFEEPGELSLQIKGESGRWKTMRKIEINKIEKPSTSST